jgi:fumarate reductase subunit D
MISNHRKHTLWLAFLVHRVSGLCLALFLPIHFYVLGLALDGSEDLDRFLSWTDHPLVKLVELFLVFFLSIHLFGGLRLLALEFLPWNPRQKSLAAAATAVAVFVSLMFLLTMV